MTQELWQRRESFDALLQMSRDLVIVIKDGRVELCRGGDSDWLIESVINGAHLDNLLPADLYAPINGAIELAQANPGEKQQLEYVLRPEHVTAFREAGLREPIWFEAGFLAIPSGEVFWSARDINERKKLQRKVTNQAQRDPLTGAYNRRALMTVMEQTVAQALRYDWTCSVMIIDVELIAGSIGAFSLIVEYFKSSLTMLL